MKLRGCSSSSHFIWSIKDGMVNKVHNTDSNGRPGLKFKNLEDIIRSTEAEDIDNFQNDYDGTEFKGNISGNKATFLPFADRNTRARDSYIVEDGETEYPTGENSLEEMTLSQLKKKCKKKKRKASESVLLTPKAEDDDSDLGEPLRSFRVKVSKSSQSKMTPVKGSPPISSRSPQSATSVSNTFTNHAPLFSKDLFATITVKTETPEVEHLECMKSGSFTNEGEICGFNKVSLDQLDSTESTPLVSPIVEDRMKLDNEDNIAKDLILPVSEVDKEHVNQSSVISSLQVVNYTSGVKDSDSTIDNDPCVDLGRTSDSYMFDEYAEGSPTNQEYNSPSLMPSYLCLPWKSHSWLNPDANEDDMVSEDPIPVIPEEKQSLTSDNNSSVSEDTSIYQEKLSFVSVNSDSEVKLSNHNYEIDVMSEAPEVRNSNRIETRHPERLPLTRKAISPTSQEKLCLAMKSAELLEDTEHYKCKEKLYFGEQAEMKLSSIRSNVDDNEPSVLPQQAVQFIQNKDAISPKQMLKKQKNYKKGSPPKAGLDGPRLCRSLPRLSTGCTSIQGCSESAIAFSQRQMHDIESLALKLMTELKSMKGIVEEKLLYEAYRSTSLKNEADEVKSAIKSATKAEEAARKWLSMMARDCNRFCKIMKLNKDDNTSPDPASGSTIQEKPLRRERKKISFADEAGGSLCDVKVFENDLTSLELMENPESSPTK